MTVFTTAARDSHHRVDPNVYHSKEKAARAARDAQWQGKQDVSSLVATASTSHHSVMSEDLSDLGAHNLYENHGATRDPIFTMSYPNAHSDIRGKYVERFHYLHYYQCKLYI